MQARRSRRIDRGLIDAVVGSGGVLPAGCARLVIERLRRMPALVALLILCGATPVALAAPAWRPDSPLASHAMLYLNAPYGFKQSMFEQSAGLRASSIRVDIALSAVFAADGSEHWQQVDEVMALARAHRLRPVGILLATPWFISACPAQADAYRCPPSDVEAWARMVSRVVAHTRGVIDTFEILNEADGSWAFAGTAADYATLLRAGHDAIAAANPGAKIAIAGTMSLRSRAWLEQVFRAAGPHPERLYDIANVHIRGSLPALPRIVRAWRGFFAAHDGAGKPLWVTEFGYPSDPAYQYDRRYRSGPASQASYLCRGLRALLTAGAAKVFVTLRDNLGGQFASEGVIAGRVGDPPQAHPLVVRKPAFAALRRLAGRMAGSRRGPAAAVRAVGDSARRRAPGLDGHSARAGLCAAAAEQELGRSSSGISAAGSLTLRGDMQVGRSHK
jgi:hypothetical protein